MTVKCTRSAQVNPILHRGRLGLEQTQIERVVDTQHMVRFR